MKEEMKKIIRSEHDHPRQVLGPHKTVDGTVVRSYFPGAVQCEILVRGQKPVTMEMIEDGYFEALLDYEDMPKYHYRVTYGQEHVVKCRDPYAFPSTISTEDIKKFKAGIHYDIYKVLGAHSMTLRGIKGVRFAVWAPNAVRVSVVGDFNQWDGRRHPMQRCDGNIHELFIPELEEGAIYKYEIKLKSNTIVLKSDPYGTRMQMRPDNASIICDIDKCHKWKDKEWMNRRKKEAGKEKPEFIYELHLAGFMRSEPVYETDAEGKEVLVKPAGFLNYRDLAKKITDYVLDMGYTHVELMPIMEHPLDASWGYQVTGYYAPTSRYGTPEDFMYFVDYLHQHEIGVILDWVPAHFPRDLNGLARFDGEPLYEDPNPKRGEHPHWGTLVFDYGRKEVSNFLIANALYWIEQYHIDGLRMDAVASMLYLDYGREYGEWCPNIYGGKENLEAIEFLKHLNSVMKKRNPDIQMVAEESTAYPMVTGNVDRGSLGFDYKWNMGWMNDFLKYMSMDPLFRKSAYNQLLFSMMYAYSEKYILVLSHDEVVHGKGSMIGKMPGSYEDKFANLRVAYGYMACHPGKKLLFMGQDYAQFSEFDESKSLEWFMLENEMHKKMHDYMRELIHLYREYPALYALDNDPEGFKWTNCISPEESIVAFVRKTSKKDETLLVVCNFTPVVREDHPIGVPFKGKYKEIFNSDAEKFGGQGHLNTRMKQSKAEECDGWDNSIKITIPPLGISIFKCTPLEPAKKNKK